MRAQRGNERQASAPCSKLSIIRTCESYKFEGAQTQLGATHSFSSAKGRGVDNMSIVTPLVVGVLIGWVASVLKRTAGREDLIRNVGIGILGSYLGGWLVSSLFESASQGTFSFGAITASFLGAATLLFVVARLNRA